MKLRWSRSFLAFTQKVKPVALSALTAIAFAFSVAGAISAQAEAIFGATGNDRCGLGTMIFANNQSVSSQVSEEFLDAFMLNGMFSVTTGTSGCSHSGIVGISKQEMFYANANFEELKVEMAAGQGETITGLAKTMGCEDVKLFLKRTKESYPNVYSSPKLTPEEMLQNLHKELKSNPTLANDCEALNGLGA